MSILYPTSIDSFTNPTASTPRNVVSLATAQTDQNSAIIALETKVGADSSAVATSLDYLLKSTSSSNPGHKHTLATGATNVTASAAELNYSVGVTSAIQTQITSLSTLKAPLASPTFTGTVTLPVGLSGIASLSSGVVSAVTAPSGTIVGTTDTQTVTNKRVTKRVLLLSAGSATPAINTDNYDAVHITAQSAAITSFTTNLTGTPVEGDSLIIDITDDGTARAITWGAKFESSGNVTLPTTTVLGVRLDVGFRWNTVTSKWRCVAVA